MTRHHAHNGKLATGTDRPFNRGGRSARNPTSGRRRTAADCPHLDDQRIVNSDVADAPWEHLQVAGKHDPEAVPLADR